MRIRDTMTLVRAGLVRRATEGQRGMSRDDPEYGDDLDDIDPEDAAVQLADVLEEIRAVEEAVVERIRGGAQPKAYLAWAEQAFPRLVPRQFDTTSPDAASPVWLARQFWNVFPVEANGFEPLHIPLPQPSEPCLCDSGRAFEDCCSSKLGDPEPLHPDTLWATLMRTEPQTHWVRHAAAGTLPAGGLICLSHRLMDAEEWQTVVDILRAKTIRGELSGEHCLQAMDCLCESYRSLERPDDALALLRRIATHKETLVRTVANRRLAIALHAEGERDRAWRAFKEVARLAPDDPATGLVELVLLSGERRFDDAEDRAGYWAGHLIEVGVEPDDPMFHLIDCFEDDARYGCDEYHRWFMPDDLALLADLVDDELIERDPPKLKWRRIQGAENDELLRGAHDQVLPAAARRLEAQWDRMQPAPEGGDFDLVAVVDWLQERPQAFDSFVVLDDLARLLEAAEEPLGRSDNRWYMAVLEWATEMLDQSWPTARGGTMPWVIMENRPALRLLASCIDALDEGAAEDAGAERLDHLTNLYLRLNPPDNHGLRCQTANRLLREGRDADALEIAERYPDDMFAETCYGRALALFRLGREEEAGEAMRTAAERLPRVLKHLQRERAPRPRPDDFGMVIGGEYQAWLYRQDMRETWLAVPGIQDWLTKFSRGAPRRKSRRRRR